jgi:enoyl-CoA hydratase/carnithine racemase
MEFETITYDVLDAGEHGIATVTLDRPETRNAQNKRMTYELNAAFDDASRRKDVKVIVLQADGPHFCSGHDMRDTESMRQFDVVGPYGGFGREGTWPGRRRSTSRCAGGGATCPSRSSPPRRARRSQAV